MLGQTIDICSRELERHHTEMLAARHDLKTCLTKFPDLLDHACLNLKQKRRNIKIKEEEKNLTRLDKAKERKASYDNTTNLAFLHRMPRRRPWTSGTSQPTTNNRGPPRRGPPSQQATNAPPPRPAAPSTNNNNTPSFQQQLDQLTNLVQQLQDRDSTNQNPRRGRGRGPRGRRNQGPYRRY